MRNRFPSPTSLKTKMATFFWKQFRLSTNIYSLKNCKCSKISSTSSLARTQQYNRTVAASFRVKNMRNVFPSPGLLKPFCTMETIQTLYQHLLCKNYRFSKSKLEPTGYQYCPHIRCSYHFVYPLYIKA